MQQALLLASKVVVRVTDLSVHLQGAVADGRPLCAAESQEAVQNSVWTAPQSIAAASCVLLLLRAAALPARGHRPRAPLGRRVP